MMTAYWNKQISHSTYYDRKGWTQESRPTCTWMANFISTSSPWKLQGKESWYMTNLTRAANGTHTDTKAVMLFQKCYITTDKHPTSPRWIKKESLLHHIVLPRNPNIGNNFIKGCVNTCSLWPHPRPTQPNPNYLTHNFRGKSNSDIKENRWNIHHAPSSPPTSDTTSKGEYPRSNPKSIPCDNFKGWPTRWHKSNQDLHRDNHLNAHPALYSIP